MQFYEPLVAQGYEWINCCNEADYEVFLGFDGSPRSDRWKAIKVERVRADHRQGFNPSDFPWLGAHALVMRRKAVDALIDILDAHGEVLLLATDDDIDLFVFNARAINALDEEQSSIVRFSGTNRIMRITKIAFFQSVIHDVDVFRLPHRASSTYVSQRFIDRVNETGLVGLEFKRVWSSD